MNDNNFIDNIYYSDFLQDVLCNPLLPADLELPENKSIKNNQ